MATELGSAFISVGLGTNNLAGDIKKAFGASGDVGEKAGKEAGSRFGGAVGLAAAAVGALGIGSFFKSAIGGAADLEQSVGAIDSVFKGSASQMHEWAQSAATDVGLSANEFNELGTLIGSQLKNGGTAMDELGPKTKELISTGADLASMFGGTTSEAVDALSSALKGERDPIERYGVSLNQAKIDAEAAALGFGKVNGQFEQNAQQAATLSLITKQTADATGNFGRETDTLAHKQQVLNAQLANGKARIGTELLPVVAALTGALSKALGPAINGTVAGIKTIVGAGQGLYALFAKGDFTSALANAFKVEEDSAFVGVLFKIRDTALEVAGGFRAMGAAFKAGDGDITSSGLAGVMEQIGNAARKIVNVGRGIWAGFKMPADVAASFGANLNPILAFGQTVRDSFDKVINTAKALWAGFVMPPEVAASFGDKLNPLLAAGSGLRDVFKSIWEAIAPLIPQVAEFATTFSPLGMIFEAIKPVLPELLRLVGELASILGGALGEAVKTLTPVIGTLVEHLSKMAVDLMPSVAEVVRILGQAMTDLGPVIGEVIAKLAPLIGDLITKLAPVITDLVTNILPPLVTIFSDIVEAIGPLILVLADSLIPIIESLLPVVEMVFKAAADVITNAMQAIQGVVQVVSGLISGDWGKVWEGIKNTFSGVWNAMTSIVQGALGIIGQVVLSGLGLVRDFVGSALSGIGRFFSDTWNSVVNGVGGFIGNLVGFFAGLPGQILGALGNLGSLLVGAAGQIMSGFLSGLRDGFESVKNFVGGIGQWIADNKGPKAYDLALLVPAGGWIMDGLESGIENSLPSLRRTLGGVSSIIAAGVTGAGLSAGSYTPASVGIAGGGAGFTNYGPIHVRDENEMARMILNKQRDAQAAYGF